MLRPVGPAQLPARHGERLAGGPDGNGAVPHARQRGYAHHLMVVVHHVLVDVVTDHQHVVFLAEIADVKNLLPAENLYVQN